MERYIFSGSLTGTMHDMLLAAPNFKPLSILVTQLDRPGVRHAVEWRREGKFCDFFFLDSGAFSVHTGKAKTTADEYIDFINSIDDAVDACAQLDTIPGTFGQAKTPQDYKESAEKSWENFLYMRTKLRSPNKVMPVFHYGESMDALRNMLEWRSDDGEKLQYIGISPANDASQAEKNIYMSNVREVIAKSSNPDVKTHLYGMTSLDALSKYDCYSADSISHRSIGGYGKVLSPTFGVISVSKKSRTSMNKSSQSFLDTAGEAEIATLTKEIERCGLTVDQVLEDSNARVVFTMLSIMELIEGKYKYKPTNVTKAKRLFNI